MSDPRVPREIAEFNGYIRVTNTRQLATNTVTSNTFWTDYGWSTAESGEYTTDWHDKWVNDLYPKYIDPTTSTSPVKKAVRKHIDDFVEWEQEHHLLDRIVSCGKANVDDASIWHVDLERDEPSTPETKIPGKPVPSVQSSGPGRMDVKVKGSEDESRPSIPRDDGADSVQYAFAIFDEMPDEEAALNPDDRDVFTKDISKKAHFTVDLNSRNRRKWVVFYFRWYHTSRPNLAGDWTEMVSLIIG